MLEFAGSSSLVVHTTFFNQLASTTSVGRAPNGSIEDAASVPTELTSLRFFKAGLVTVRA